jgi:hypothetical protein
MISEPRPDAGGGDTLWAVPGREHPAAKAGRFVRAAGRAGAAAAREYERQAAERPAPVRAEPPAPPPALPTNGPLGWAVFIGFVTALVTLALVALRVEKLFGSHAAALAFRLAAAAILFLEAYLLTSNWQGANQRLGQRLLNRVWGPRGAVTRREKTFARVLRDVLTLIGIAFLAGAVFELLAATIGS